MLLAEKASWSTGSAPTTAQSADTDAIKRQLETEKSELQKARDEALAQVKVS